VIFFNRLRGRKTFDKILAAQRRASSTNRGKELDNHIDNQEERQTFPPLSRLGQRTKVEYEGYGTDYMKSMYWLSEPMASCE
jgi:hypothetical protein